MLGAGTIASPADPWTARLFDRLAAGLAALADDDEAAVCAVSGASGVFSIVEGRAERRARPGQGPAFALAHLLEPRSPGARPSATIDHSWALVVVGNDDGGVAGIVRAVLGCPGCAGPAPWAQAPLDRLRHRLVAASGAPRPPARVIAFPVERAGASPSRLGVSSAP